MCMTKLLPGNSSSKTPHGGREEEVCVSLYVCYITVKGAVEWSGTEQQFPP